MMEVMVVMVTRKSVQSHHHHHHHQCHHRVSAVDADVVVRVKLTLYGSRRAIVPGAFRARYGATVELLI